LIGHGKCVYHTGGYLGNGEVVWLLARLPGEIRIRGNDVVEPYMLFTNSHDGSIAIDFRLTTIRVVCQNTLNLALADRNKRVIFKRAHQGSPRGLEAEAAHFFQISTEAISALGDQFRAMNDRTFHIDEFRGFLERLLPFPPPLASSLVDKRRHRFHDARVNHVAETHEAIKRVFLEGIKNGVSVPPAEETLWGAFNTITAFVDHVQPIEGDRYAHSLFGSGAALKQKAHTLAVSYLP
jgi:phage/plasmid-like protein (TIGR03299 family)